MSRVLLCQGSVFHTPLWDPQPGPRLSSGGSFRECGNICLVLTLAAKLPQLCHQNQDMIPDSLSHVKIILKTFWADV